MVVSFIWWGGYDIYGFRFIKVKSCLEFMFWICGVLGVFRVCWSVDRYRNIVFGIFVMD